MVCRCEAQLAAPDYCYINIMMGLVGPAVFHKVIRCCHQANCKLQYLWCHLSVSQVPSTQLESDTRYLISIDLEAL